MIMYDTVGDGNWLGWWKIVISKERIDWLINYDLISYYYNSDPNL